MSEFQEIGGASKYVNIAPKGVPAFNKGDTIIEGVFTRTFKGKFGLQHEFKVANDLVVVNGFGHLDYKMKTVVPNSLVRVTYEGKEVLAKGKYAGTASHQCKVFTATASTPVFNESVATNTNKEDDGFLA